MKVATITIRIPNSQLGDVLAFLHRNKIADVDLKFAESKAGNAATAKAEFGNRYEVSQTDFFRQLLAKHPQGMTPYEAKEAWARAGYPAPSFYSALSRAKVQKIIKVRGDKIHPAQEKSE